MIKGIAHVAFLVSDLERSIAFYKEALGFEKKFTLFNDDGTPWLVYLKMNESQFLELFPTTEPLDLERKSSYLHLCIEVEDIHEVVEHFTSKGIVLDEPIIKGLDNNYQCWIHDPDGNPIEIMEYGKDALQLL